MRLLDLFCCAGGAAMGYHRAGFDEIVGVDIKPQSNYPFKFVQGDALEYAEKYGWMFDAIHASPPCQEYSTTKHLPNVGSYPKLVELSRKALIATSKPYVIENVPGAPLENPVRLCGLHFGLKVIRWRHFETNPFLLSPCVPIKKCGGTNSSRGYSAHRYGAEYITVAGNNFDPIDGAKAMGIDWMTRAELAEAIPPAYTEWIGRQLLAAIQTVSD